MQDQDFRSIVLAKTRDFLITSLAKNQLSTKVATYAVLFLTFARITFFSAIFFRILKYFLHGALQLSTFLMWTPLPCDFKSVNYFAFSCAPKKCLNAAEFQYS